MYWKVTAKGAHFIHSSGYPTGIIMREGDHKVMYTEDPADIPRYIEMLKKYEGSEQKWHTNTKKKP